jgi:hypothetical protein
VVEQASETTRTRVTEVRASSCGAFHRQVGGDAGKDDCVDAGASQDDVEFGSVEATDPVMGQYDIATPGVRPRR